MDEADERGVVRFEDGLAALEQLVGRLESGELSLEDALKAFEEGVGLVRALNERLTAAERRIELLTRDEDGRLLLQAAEENES